MIGRCSQATIRTRGAPCYRCADRGIDRAALRSPGNLHLESAALSRRPPEAGIALSAAIYRGPSPPLRACQFHPECCCLLACRRQRALQFAGDDACLRFLPRHGLQRLDVFPRPGAQPPCCWALHFRVPLLAMVVRCLGPRPGIVWNKATPSARRL